MYILIVNPKLTCLVGNKFRPHKSYSDESVNSHILTCHYFVNSLTENLTAGTKIVFFFFSEVERIKWAFQKYNF